MAEERDLHEAADTLVFQAQTAFSGLATGEQKRQALMDFNIGLVRLIESVGMMALKITGEIDMEVSNQTINILPRKPFAPTELEADYDEQGPGLMLQQSKLAFHGRLQIGSTVRLTRATGEYSGQLVPVLGIAQSDVHGWMITVHRGGKRFAYPIYKIEPLVETYRGYQIVLRQRRYDVFHFIYDPEGYAACGHGNQGRWAALVDARREVDRQINRNEQVRAQTLQETE